MTMRLLSQIFVCLLTLGSIVQEGRAASLDMEAKRKAEVGLISGMVLDMETAHLAEGLLPPEILEHYKKGDYENAIGEWKDGAIRWSDEFMRSSRQNAETLDVNAEGTIVERATGKQPAFVYGLPFPNIDPNDPKAGVKIIWNYFYGDWLDGGNRHNWTALDWLGKSGLERRVIMDVYFANYDGVPAAHRPAENPNNFLAQFLAAALEPNDMYGTTALTWRYRDPSKRDSNWAYVPALRRVRQVSPANRSDGFLGSDMSQDDGQFFDGKVQDFTFKLIGEQEVLRIADPYSLSGDTKYVPLPGGGWRVPFKDIPMVGHEQPGWKGVAWAPVNFVLAKRPSWVLEVIPKDRYYLFGKIILYIDQEDYRGSWSRKFSWQGELLNGYQVANYLNGTPDDGKHYLWRHALYYQVAENYKQGRATYAGAMPVGRRGDAPNDLFVPYDPSFFDYQTLYRFGK